jgi:spore coat protein CotH
MCVTQSIGHERRHNILISNKVLLLSFVLTTLLIGPAGAESYLTGDLNGDRIVDLEDLWVLAKLWVHPNCLSFGCEADLNGADGVNMVDFSMLAENWRVNAAGLVISEFVTLNGSKPPLGAGDLLDEDGDSSDWIEIYNSTDTAINLAGWYLTNDANDLTRWEFPSVQIGPGQFEVIFASGKNRDDPDGELHTNFQLGSGEGFLALVKPNGRTIVHAYEYPQQFGDVSYGLSSEAAGLATETILIRESAPARALIPTDSSLGLSWTEPGFDDSEWLTGTTGVGYDYGALVGLDVRAMRNVNQTVYVRIPFAVDDVSVIDELTLRMKYEDGFVAYLNGVALGGDNAPGPHELTWNSGATAVRDDNIAVNYQDFDITAYKDLLVVGDNVLAIHGLNAGAGSSDLLVLPELIATELESVDISSTIEGYFYQPTPGKANGSAVANLGPAIRNVTENPPPPTDNEDLMVTAKVTETFDPVAVVMLFYRVNFGQEITVPMVDNGTGGDAVADDGIYTGIIPSALYGPGDMVRWRILSPDIKSCASINPLFLIKEGRRQSPEYFGTVVVDPSITTALPVFQYFVQNTGAEGTRTGTRASVFYLDEFYDNVFIRVRGGYTTQGRKFEFNDGHHFRFDPDLPRVDEINLNEAGRATNAQSAESTYMRQVLSWETYDNAGAPGSISFPMHVRRNGTFLDVRVFIEQQDRDFLRREGLDPDGALYKMYNELTSSTGGVEKKTRQHENNSDLQALVSGVSPGNPSRAVYLFDNVNIPAVINYIAATTIIHDNDHVQKNYFLHRDTEGAQEWMFLPWDKDLTFGRNWGIGGIQARYDPYSHPLFGDDSHRKVDNLWNRLIDAIHDNSTARQMYLRRLRTLMDELLQPPGTPYNELKFEQRVSQLQAMLERDVGNSTFYTEVTKLKTDYLAVRRQHLFNNHGIHNPAYPDCARIPDAQPNGVEIDFGAIEYNPASGNQDEEYIQLINPNLFAVDISGWHLEGAVEHTFPPGTVIPAGSPLFVTPNAVAFRNRTTSPKGGQQLLVQGNYKGHLSSWGETINLLDSNGTLVSTVTYPGNPSDQQRYLRITEIMYNPGEGGAFDNEQYEYIELKNVGIAPLLLDGVRFTEGITFSFPGISLAAGDYVLLVANQAAFSSRHTVPEGVQVLGPYDGRLSNSGENVKLEDSTNSTILEFRYRDGWREITDGGGFSLTIIDANNPDPDSWSEKDSWRASAFYGGSPGWDDTGIVPEPGSVVINEVLAHAHADASDWIELHNTTDKPTNIGGWFLSDSDSNLTKYEIADGTVIPVGGYIVFYEGQHFGNSDAAGCHTPFALSENGDQVYLSSAQAGVLTGYQEVEDFDASETGVAFGRYCKTSTDNYNFVAMSENTPGKANAYPKVGPIVINEIMYNPGSGNQNEEYIELFNISSEPVTLYRYDKSEPWRFTDGIEFVFPSDPVSTIPAGGYLLLVKDLAAFAARYGAAPAGVQVLGPYDGQLQNGGEKLELSMPGDVDESGTRYYIRIDRLNYSDGFHPEDCPGGVDLWPTEADGGGMSLSRKVPADYGNDVINWKAAAPSPGRVNP